jgi:hypothetical protein
MHSSEFEALAALQDVPNISVGSYTAQYRGLPSYVSTSSGAVGIDPSIPVVKTPAAIKAELAALVAAYASILEAPGAFTQTTYQAFAAAYNAIVALSRQSAPSQADAARAVAALNAAVARLTPAGSAKPAEVISAKSALEVAIAAAAPFVAKRADYTPDSFTTFFTIFNLARALAAAAPSQAVADAIIGALSASRAALIPKVTPDSAGGTAKSIKSAKPKIKGKAKVGKKLTVKKGSWQSGAKFTYKWYRNGKAIKKATKAKYKLKAKDKGKRISVKVTGKKTGFKTVTRVSKKTAKVKRK